MGCKIQLTPRLQRQRLQCPVKGMPPARDMPLVKDTHPVKDTPPARDTPLARPTLRNTSPQVKNRDRQYRAQNSNLRVIKHQPFTNCPRRTQTSLSKWRGSDTMKHRASRQPQSFPPEVVSTTVFRAVPCPLQSDLHRKVVTAAPLVVHCEISLVCWWTVDSHSIQAFERPFCIGHLRRFGSCWIGSHHRSVTGCDPTTIHKSLMITRMISFLSHHF